MKIPQGDAWMKPKGYVQSWRTSENNAQLGISAAEVDAQFRKKSHGSTFSQVCTSANEPTPGPIRSNGNDPPYI